MRKKLYLERIKNVFGKKNCIQKKKTVHRKKLYLEKKINRKKIFFRKLSELFYISMIKFYLDICHFIYNIYVYFNNRLYNKCRSTFSELFNY